MTRKHLAFLLGIIPFSIWAALVADTHIFTWFEMVLSLVASGAFAIVGYSCPFVKHH
jgi:hypothetical protein